MSDQKPRKRAFFSFHHHKRPSSHHSGREFYYRVFLPSPINDSESFTRKRMHWHRSPAIRCWCLCRLSLNQSFEGKKASNDAADTAALRFRCRQSKDTVLRDTSPRGNSAPIEDFGSNSCRCIWMWRRAVTTLPPREGKHVRDEVPAARPDSAVGTLHAPRVQPRATALARP